MVAVKKVRTPFIVCNSVFLALLLVLIVCEPTRIEAQNDQRKATRTGDIRVHARFHSRFLRRNRNIVTYPPPGYESESLRRYPALYMHDGQNLFDGATSYIPG